MSKTRKRLIIFFGVIFTLFFAWRFIRPLNIFVVDDKFALPIQTAVPEGLESLRAEGCGVCHTAIYQEWSQSIHAHAWVEEYYVADMAFEENPPVCKNCHIQLERQRENKVVGFKDADRLYPLTVPNPDFDPVLQNEGVTCAVCHVRDGKIIGPYPTTAAPHPVVVQPEFLSAISPCKICHVLPGKRWDMFYDRSPCGTLSEITERNIKADCVGCHLPRVTRPMAVGGPVRTGGKHLFQGGHTPSQVKNSLRVDLGHRKYRNDLIFTATLTNYGAHHHLPTGTPDRHLTLTFTLRDANQKVIETETFTLKRTIMWRPFIVDLADNRLAFNSPQSFPFTVHRTPVNKTAHLEVEVRYHLLTEARRQRIGYHNTTPIHYPVFSQSIQLDTLFPN